MKNRYRVLTFLLLIASQVAAQRPAYTSPSAQQMPANGSLAIPAGSQVELMLISPIMASSAKPGANIYAKTIAPLAVQGRMVVPPETFVQGVITFLTTPTRKAQTAEIVIRYTKVLYINGYTLDLDAQRAGQTDAENDELIAASDVHLSVSTANDVLFDKGTQFGMEFQLPVTLDADQVKDAAAKTPPLKAQDLQLKSATSCIPTAGTPGTPDTGSHGTPDIVIPGTPSQTISTGPDTPPITIPGTPDTVIPGTPDTFVAGDPGTPGTYCPPRSVEMAKTKPVMQSHALVLNSAVMVGSSQLEAGNYDVEWDGAANPTRVDFKVKKKTVASFNAERKYFAVAPQKDDVELAGGNGSQVLKSLRFANFQYALYPVQDAK